MLLGVSSSLEHRTPQEWAAKHAALGLKCVNFPVDCTAVEMIRRIIDEAQPHLATKEDPAMPMIIEHLGSDSEYVSSVDYVLRSI